MFRTGVALVALSLGTAGAASAEPTLGAVLSALTRQGFSGFEISREAGQVKVEASSGETNRELIYDAATGRLLRDETGRSDNRTTGPVRQARSEAGDDHGRAEAGTTMGARARTTTARATITAAEPGGAAVVTTARVTIAAATARDAAAGRAAGRVAGRAAGRGAAVTTTGRGTTDRTDLGQESRGIGSAPRT